jgi:hypothetical protein
MSACSPLLSRSVLIRVHLRFIPDAFLRGFRDLRVSIFWLRPYRTMRNCISLAT